jgi:dATP pyrophosphohydrolase
VARTPNNVLVLPFRRLAAGALEFAIFLRADESEPCWQGVAGGVEEGESPFKAARRELSEEAGLSPGNGWIALDTRGSVPASVFSDSNRWGPETFVVIEHTFGVELAETDSIDLSDEHSEVRWVSYDTAAALLRFDSNRTALWELRERLARRGAG